MRAADVSSWRRESGALLAGRSRCEGPALVLRSAGSFLRHLRAARVRNRPAAAEASPALSGRVRVQPEGDERLSPHAFTFARIEPWFQLVRPSFVVNPREATMGEQLQLALLCRLDGPAIVPPQALRAAKTYRQAVRLCRALSPRSRLTLRQLAGEAGLPAQHVSDYFNADDKPGRRDLPGDRVAAIERVLGNSAVSQWHAMQAQLTVLEELQASARAAA